MIWTDNPERDADRYDAEQERNLAYCPICDKCGEPIQDEYAYQFVDGSWMCEECIESCRKRTF